MFKNIILFICLFASNIAIGQKRPLLIGVKAGYLHSNFNLSNLPSSDFSKPKSDDAIYAGITADIPLSRKISIMPEVLYTLVPGIQSYYNGVGPMHDEFSHVLIPLLFKYKLGHWGIYLGPQANILATAKGFYYSSTLYYDPLTNSYYHYALSGNIKDSSYSKFSLSGIVGIEYTFKYRFGFEVRYEKGLGDYRASNAASVLTKPGSIQHSAIQAGLYFRFGKKPKSS